jgi:hypothetical protein
MEIPDLPIAGLRAPLLIYLDLDVETVDRILERLADPSVANAGAATTQ